jgi:uncharacterized protein YqhQ
MTVREEDSSASLTASTDVVTEAESAANPAASADVVTEADSGANLTASKDAPVGGQAVLEGVMMRGVAHWAVAVRKPADEGELGEVATQTFEFTPGRRRRFFRLPIVRGVVALVESIAIGMKALGIAAAAQLGEEEGEETLSGGVWIVTVVIALAFAIGLFFVVPVTLTSLIRGQLGSSWLFWLVEGVVRTVIFLGYLVLLSRIRDLRRVLEYHGAEHKVISCYEAADELVPERAARYSRLHPRCGTSFLLVVMVVAIFVFAPIGLPAWWVLVLTRIIGVPVIAGLSFELIRYAGRHRSQRWVQVVIWPGMQLQRLTTSEPDHEQLAVAIAALNAVLERETPGELAAADLLGLEVAA